MYEQAFDRIDTLLRTTTCQTELDYIEQTSWLLFLKYLDGQEKDAETTAKLAGKTYKHILDPQYRWGSWAMPKDKAGNLLHDKAMNGDDLIAFVEGKLFPYLRKFKERADSADTVEYKIGAIFSEMRNKVNSGFTLRDILAIIDSLAFGSRDDKHELSALYEEKIRNMGNAGRNGGEYYTPRPLIRAMIKVIDPKIGEKVYDGAVGSAGFLCEAYEFMSAGKLTTSEKKTLSEKTFYGKEKKPLAYVIAIMNLMLHGVKSPNIINTNTLAENINDIQEKDRYEVVLANPPFGGKERKEVQENFPIQTNETASLFLQHFIKILKAGGRGAIVIKNTFLSNTDKASIALRKKLVTECNLHTVLDCPAGTFQGAGVHTVVLFFTKGVPTKKIWYYQLNPGRRMGKTTPLNDADLVEFLKMQSTGKLSENSWCVNLNQVEPNEFRLTPINPKEDTVVKLRETSEIIEEIRALDKASESGLKNLTEINNALKEIAKEKPSWPISTVGDLCEFRGGGTPSKSVPAYWSGDICWVSSRDVKTEVIEDTHEHITQEAINNSSASIIPKNTVIMVVRSGILARIVPIAITGKDMAINQDLKALKCNDLIMPEYLYEVLMASMPELLNKVGLSATVHKLMTNDIKGVKVPLPPIRTQALLAIKMKLLREQITQLTSICESKQAAVVGLHLAARKQIA
jgi:type I restriction enzyme M protein